MSIVTPKIALQNATNNLKCNVCMQLFRIWTVFVHLLVDLTVDTEFLTQKLMEIVKDRTVIYHILTYVWYFSIYALKGW